MRIDQPEVTPTTKKSTLDYANTSKLPLWGADIVFSLLFWSQLCEIWSTIWYIPMNAMKISGYELFLVFLALPSMLAFPWFRQFCHQRAYLRYGSLIGLLACLFRYQGPQILFLAIGTAASLTYWLLDSSENKPHVVYSSPIGPGLLMSLRWADASLNPIFHSRIVALLALGAGVWACNEYCRNSTNTPGTAGTASLPKASAATFQALMIGLFFGAVLFNYHAFLTQVSVVVRWVDSPTEPLGWVMLVFFTLVVRPEIIFPSAAIAGLSGISFVASIVLHAPSLVRISLGILLLVSLKQQLPRALLAFAAANRPGTIILSAVISYSFFGLATVWTVAYPFVPGGDLLRERTAHVFILTFICMIAASMTSSLGFRDLTAGERPKRPLDFLGTIQKVIVVTVIVCCLWRHISRAHHAAPDAHGPEAIRSAVWAVHFGYDNFGQNSFDRIVARLNETSANVIALVETDLARVFNGNWDLVDYLQQHTGMYADYGPGTMNNTWGCALLSAFPIVRADRYNLPSPQGEVACLIDATIRVGDESVDVIVTHFGNDPHPHDRYLQTKDSVARGLKIKSASKRALWLGYLTDRPGSIAHRMMLSSGWEDSTEDTDRWCLYIFSQRLQQHSFRRFPHLDDSDTEIQYASFDL